MDRCVGPAFEELAAEHAVIFQVLIAALKRGDIPPVPSPPVPSDGTGLSSRRSSRSDQRLVTR